MRDMLVLTVSGPDRPGLVEALAAKLAGVGANWEESRMARLAGQFAGVLLVTVERARTDELVAALRGKDIGGLQVVVHSTRAPDTAKGTRLRLSITAQDRPGIIRDVSPARRRSTARPSTAPVVESRASTMTVACPASSEKECTRPATGTSGALTSMLTTAVRSRSTSGPGVCTTVYPAS